MSTGAILAVSLIAMLTTCFPLFSCLQTPDSKKEEFRKYLEKPPTRTHIIQFSSSIERRDHSVAARRPPVTRASSAATASACALYTLTAKFKSSFKCRSLVSSQRHASDNRRAKNRRQADDEQFGGKGMSPG